MPETPPAAGPRTLHHSASAPASTGGSPIALFGAGIPTALRGASSAGSPTTVALGVPLRRAPPEEQAAEEGVHATAGALALAGVEAATTEPLLPGTSAPPAPAALEAAAAALAPQASMPPEPANEALLDLALLSAAAASGTGQSLDVFAF